MLKWFKKVLLIGDNKEDYSITISDILLDQLRARSSQQSMNDFLLKRIEDLEEQVEALSKIIIERKMDQ